VKRGRVKRCRGKVKRCKVKRGRGIVKREKRERYSEKRKEKKGRGIVKREKEKKVERIKMRCRWYYLYKYVVLIKKIRFLINNYNNPFRFIILLP
jgi:hypothetical protein